MTTIKDIADMTGISRGTVDRVLHGRGRVSESKSKAVLDAVEKTGFRPNEFASALAGNKTHRIVCLIPEFTPGDIWSITAGGFRSVAHNLMSLGVGVEIKTYDQYDAASYKAVCEGVLADPPSGLIVAPMFRSATISLVRELSDRSIPYSYIDTKLDDDSYFGFFGLPMYQSGYLGANVLTHRCPSCISEIVNVRIKRDKSSMSDPLILRRAGFLDYINEHLPGCTVREITINPNSREESFEVLDAEFMSDRDKPRSVVMFNSRVHLVAEYIRERGVRNCSVLGYDMVEKNLKALKDGSVSWLIAQHSDIQAGNALRTLAEYLSLKRTIQKRDNYSQMDILNKFNCDYYV